MCRGGKDIDYDSMTSYAYLKMSKFGWIIILIDFLF